MSSGINAPSAEFLCLRIGQIPMISLIKDTICMRTSRSYGKEVAFEASPVRIDVEDRRTLKYMLMV